MKKISIEQKNGVIYITTYDNYIKKAEKITANQIRIEFEEAIN